MPPYRNSASSNLDAQRHNETISH
eukprot:SAG31_NODE_2633_length_5345_cov_70.416317_1_plen_23_part_10